MIFLGCYRIRKVAIIDEACEPILASQVIRVKDEKKQVLLNFNNEIKMYNEIDKINTDIKQIHSNFLEVK